MARAVYSNADVYLLDDPLSAVDAHVGASLFNDCIKGFLATKTRILVTHQLQFLHDCDLIIVIKKGQITEMGTHQKLMSNGSNFAEMMAKHVTASSAKDDDPPTTVTEVTKDEKKDQKKDGDKKPTGPLPDFVAKLMQAEQRSGGGVSNKVYINYMVAVGGIGFALFILMIYVAETAANMVSNYWVSYWSVVANSTTNPNNSTLNATDLFSYASQSEIFQTGRNTLEFGFGSIKIFDELGLGVLLSYG